MSLLLADATNVIFTVATLPTIKEECIIYYVHSPSFAVFVDTAGDNEPQ